MPLPDVLAIEAATRRVSGTVRVTPDGSLQWTEFSAPKEMLAEDAREAIRGKPRPERDPLEVLRAARAADVA